MRGRKPIPTKLHILHGNPSEKNLKNRVEPEPVVEIPECPSVLKGEARREWRRITIELHKLGLISEVDRNTLAVYCKCWGRWFEAEMMILKHGELIKTPQGYPAQSPYLTISNRMIDNMKWFLSEFGMSPAARVRLATENVGKMKDKSEDFLFGKAD